MDNIKANGESGGKVIVTIKLWQFRVDKQGRTDSDGYIKLDRVGLLLKAAV
jgi:hypothetical protein